MKALLQSAGWDAVHDRRLANNCSLLDRPDFVIDAGYRLVVIEVDEHQHRDRTCPRTCACPAGGARSCNCQQARMFDLGQAAGMPQVWIRYNPDGFTTKLGQKGKVPPAQRRQALLRMVKSVASKDQWEDGAFTRVCYMYYDGGGNDEHQWEILDHIGVVVL